MGYRPVLSISRHRVMIILLALVAIGVAILIAVGARTPSAANATALERARAMAHVSRPASGDFARRIRVSGRRRLYLECQGRGSPTVILDAGGGTNFRVWFAHKPGLPAILPAVARFTRVCAYDRPGGVFAGGGGQPKSVSRSDPAAMPRTARDMVLDLHTLLHAASKLSAAGIRGPYILAGHSFGGLVDRLYATTYPREVAGLVSIDANTEWFIDALKRLLTREQYTNYVVYFPTYLPGFPGYSQYERPDVDASAAEMRQAQADTPLRRMPLVVLFARSPSQPNRLGYPPDWPLRALYRAFDAGQYKVAALVPGSRVVIARRSGHLIQLDQPNLVINAIRWVVGQARRH